MNPDKDLAGRVVGLLTVQHKSNTIGRNQWVCLCKCGRTVTVRGDYLRTYHTKSCGCLRTYRGPELMPLQIKGVRRQTIDEALAEVGRSWAESLRRYAQEGLI